MKRRGNYDPRLDRLSGVNWTKLCLYTVHNLNLIKSFDSRGNLSLEPWTLVYTDWDNLINERYFREELQLVSRGAVPRQQTPQGAEGWGIEEWINRHDPGDQEVLKANSGCENNYVTTSIWCCRWQLIDLWDCGFTPEVMKEVKPPIHVSEWFCAHFDCGSIFTIMVALLDEEFTFLDTYKHSENMMRAAKGGEWFTVTHVFQGYRAGMRYVLFADGGRDTDPQVLEWVVPRGSKMAAARVHVTFSDSYSITRIILVVLA